MNECLTLSLVAMSNVGKTYQSGELERAGFKRYGCDDLIEKRLGPELQALGYEGIKDVAKWMGYPYEERYSRNSKRYLELEGEVVEEALDDIEKSEHPRVVIDTTGSVIYLPRTTLARLSAMTRVVYLDAPDFIKEDLFRQFIDEPKPVCWGDSFSQNAGESNKDALARCYPGLLAYRAARYAKLAHITLDYFAVRQPGFNVDKFIAAVS